MPRRAASPAASEPELDILGSLYPGEDDGGFQSFAPDQGFDVDGILDGADGDDGGDEAFIALQQAASNRKTSNLKGRTVKKGGGFQAMGKKAMTLVSNAAQFLTAYDRSECKPSASDHEEGFHCPNPHSAQNYPARSRSKGCRRHGKNGFRKDCSVRHPDGRTTQSPQRPVWCTRTHHVSFP
jgi:ATP-dependent RNA helicase DDX54/DBP10